MIHHYMRRSYVAVHDPGFFIQFTDRFYMRRLAIVYVCKIRSICTVYYIASDGEELLGTLKSSDIPPWLGCKEMADGTLRE